MSLLFSFLLLLLLVIPIPSVVSVAYAVRLDKKHHRISPSVRGWYFWQLPHCIRRSVQCRCLLFALYSRRYVKEPLWIPRPPFFQERGPNLTGTGAHSRLLQVSQMI